MGLLDTIRTTARNTISRVRVALRLGEQPTEETPKGYGKMYAYFVTTWIGSGEEWRNMWWCPADGWRREWAEWENIEQPVSPKCGQCGGNTLNWQTAMGNLLVSHQLYPNEGPQRANLPDYVGYWEDVTGQYVKLTENIPSPNIVVVKVGEVREKHKGSLSQLSLDTCGMMLERQWETDGTMTRHVLDDSLRTWLETQGFSTDEPLVTGPDRTKKLITLAKRCGPPQQAVV